MVTFALPVLAEESLVIRALPLFEELLQLDTAVFESFNHCENSEKLQEHAGYFSADVEFYHDTGGVTWDRETMIANTSQYACGNYTRQLVAASFNVSPIKDFGAITKGEHIFCQTKTKVCEGKAEFVMVWKNTGDKWQITRVLSYGHRDNR
ncbi:nuclear transport factor 2 family protein [Simiduia curdlanivorans]|uniref:Nuclear transport factor 2 family protein n=1 Tax=Simiduia curdlanivorans TaxID=1492769 RepID=A0ABV8V0Y1_9GAMM|nr:nuclear transport factor 2 family protein [Simiduia curdlanivorans]MDN3637653.1 nuclear transport factor 2 family protein [Simiduia curdlanivorans]